jgi:hypothetical protein
MKVDKCSVLEKGEGWRFGWRPKASIYKGLLGGDNWALELTEVELRDFHRLLSQLVRTVESLKNELMDQEKIDCEIESELLWLELTGDPQSYSLRLLLNQNRRAEGNWEHPAISQLLLAMDNNLTEISNKS